MIFGKIKWVIYEMLNYSTDLLSFLKLLELNCFRKLREDKKRMKLFPMVCTVGIY